jgi:hypothetical protein
MFEPRLNMNAVDPEIDVAFGRGVALAPAQVLFRPGLLATSASTACASSACAPSRNTSVSGSIKLPGWESWKTLVLVTAYHSFAGEVEALNTPTIRRLTPSYRHQLSPIAPSSHPTDQNHSLRSRSPVAPPDHQPGPPDHHQVTTAKKTAPAGSRPELLHPCRTGQSRQGKGRSGPRYSERNYSPVCHRMVNKRSRACRTMWCRTLQNGPR